jgi:hypothetical protein
MGQKLDQGVGDVRLWEGIDIERFGGMRLQRPPF